MQRVRRDGLAEHGLHVEVLLRQRLVPPVLLGVDVQPRQVGHALVVEDLRDVPDTGADVIGGLSHCRGAPGRRERGQRAPRTASGPTLPARS